MTREQKLDLATQFFNARDVASNLEDQIDAALDAAGIERTDWGHDYYDSSIELYGCKPLTEAQQRALWEIGFMLAWSHFDGKETYYANEAVKP